MNSAAQSIDYTAIINHWQQRKAKGVCPGAE